MLELPMAFHLACLEVALVRVALNPGEGASALHHVVNETALVDTPVGEDCHALPVLRVSVPFAFVFCHDSIFIG